MQRCVKRKLKSPVTIIIGIKCTDGIVIASDSRTIYPDGHFDDNVQKLHAIHFQDKNSMIVAVAGNADFASRAIELIETAAGQINLDNYRAGADCVDKAISELRQKVREQIRGTSEEIQKQIASYSFELMIAYYYGKTPYIFTLDFEVGIAIKRDREYWAIGCGSILADFIVSRLDLSGFTTAQGMWTAIYAVEEIKKIESRCGGVTRAATVLNPILLDEQKSVAQVGENNSDGMKEAINEALEFSSQAKAEWKVIARTRINDLIARRMKRLNPT